MLNREWIISFVGLFAIFLSEAFFRNPFFEWSLTAEVNMQAGAS
jgi:hypothetical protein